MWANGAVADDMRHRVDRKADPSMLQDIFDGHHYQTLLTKDVSWKGRTLDPPRKYFSEDTDVALGFGTDGIAPLSRGVDDFWPLLLTVYNLPPELRAQREYQICCGIGPVSAGVIYS
jgi:hypothetical protein